jgi:hypothetical protein
MNAMERVHVNVVTYLAVTAYSTHGDHLLSFDAYFDERALESRKNAEIPAARTPSVLGRSVQILQANRARYALHAKLHAQPKP